MARTLTADEVRSWRLRSQRLAAGGAVATAEAVAADLCGLQAQDPRAAALAVRARSRGLTAEDVAVAQYEDRSIVRTWCIRGTLHLVASDDLPWLLSLFGPVFVDRSRRRLADYGLGDAECDRAMDVIRDALAGHGPLTRAELADQLQRAGVDCDPGTQAPYHLLRRAALLGVVCEVATEGGEAAYGLLEDWVPLGDPPDRDAALAELARRYLAAYQPATRADFASWSRLPARDVRTGWELVDGDTSRVSIGGGTATVLSDALGGRPSVAAEAPRLLPAYDTYLVGYDSREHAVSSEDERRVWPGGGVIRPTVIVDGRAVATWRLDRSNAVASVVIDPFDTFGSKVASRLEAEVDDVGRFLGSPAEYRFAPG